MFNIKKIWKKLPAELQLPILKLCCAVSAKKRDGTTMGCEPVYVVGSFRSATGVGEGARLYLRQLQAQNRRAYGVDATREMMQVVALQPDNPSSLLSVNDLDAQVGGGIVVIHANPPLFQLLLLRLSNHFLRNKRIVAYWAWELETLPKSYCDALPYVDAVEVPSAFTAQAVRKVCNKEVTVKEHPLPLPGLRKTSFGHDGVMRCLYIFDMASSCERKNPWAAIAVFAQAFPGGEGASLTLKVSQSKANPKAFARLRQVVDATPGVKIISGNYSAAELENLYLTHDVYLSTHRSEGYGLTIREAMLRGLHVVATGWSANMEFMHGPLAHPLPSKLQPVPTGMMPNCPSPVYWADVDVQASAGILRQLRQEILAVSAKMAAPVLSLADRKIS